RLRGYHTAFELRPGEREVCIERDIGVADAGEDTLPAVSVWPDAIRFLQFLTGSGRIPAHEVQQTPQAGAMSCAIDPGEVRRASWLADAQQRGKPRRVAILSGFPGDKRPGRWRRRVGCAKLPGGRTPFAGVLTRHERIHGSAGEHVGVAGLDCRGALPHLPRLRVQPPRQMITGPAEMRKTPLGVREVWFGH